MKPCAVYSLEHVADAAAGRLPEAEAALLRDHAQACPACREALTRLARVNDSLLRSDALAERHVPERDHTELMDRIARLAGREAPAAERPRTLVFRRPAVLRWVLTAAAAVVIVAGALILEMRSTDARGTPMATALSSRGSVFIDGKAVTLQVNETLRAGQTLRTGRDARIDLRLTTGIRVELNSNTTIGLRGAYGEAVVCDLPEGQLFVEIGVPAAVDSPGRTVRLRTPVGTVESSGGQFDLRVVPRASAWLGAGRLMLLALQGGDVLGHTGPLAELRLTVVSGDVIFRAPDEQPITVAAGHQLRYDPPTVTPEVRTVDAERVTVWRLDDEALRALAGRHLADLFAARRAAPLAGGRVQLDYDFLSAAEFEHDWAADSGAWQTHRDFLRVGTPAGAAAGEAPPSIVSRVAFVGDVEVRFDVTVDPVRPSTVGWAMRYAEPQPTGVAAPVAGGADIRFDGEDRMTVSLSIEGRAAISKTVGAAGPAFSFGGRIDDAVASVLLGPSGGEPTAAMAETMPETTLRRLHQAERPAPLRVAVSARGPDVVVSRITLVGRPDAAWLRQALTDLFDRDADIR